MKVKTSHVLIKSSRMEDYDIAITGTDLRTNMMEVIASLPGDSIWKILDFIKKDWNGESPFLVEPPPYIKEAILQYKALPEAEKKRFENTIYNGTKFQDDRDATIDLLTEELDKWWKEIVPIAPLLPPSPPRRRPALPPKRPRAEIASTSRDASPPARAPRAPRPPRVPRAPPATAAQSRFGDMARSYFTGLEQKVKELEEENAKLRGEVDDLAAAVRLLGKNFF
jgi:hypothetical protein